MKTLLFLLLFSAQLFAADKIVVTSPRPQYLGGGSTSIVRIDGKTVAKATTVKRPDYLGGGTVTKINDGKKTTTVITVIQPSYLGGRTLSSVNGSSTSRVRK